MKGHGLFFLLVTLTALPFVEPQLKESVVEPEGTVLPFFGYATRVPIMDPKVKITEEYTLDPKVNITEEYTLDPKVNITESGGYILETQLTGPKSYITVPEVNTAAPMGYEEDLMYKVFEPWCSQFSDTSFCPKQFRKVCGTNGITYPNHCALCAERIPDLKISKLEAC